MLTSKRLAAGCIVAIAGMITWLGAQEGPAAPTREHQWLARLVGQWTVSAQASMGPDAPAMDMEGRENVRAIGDLWVMAEVTMGPPDAQVTGILTLGYDPQKKKFVGTWIDSMTAYLWKYEGDLDASGKSLTLLTEGPSPLGPPGQMHKYREVIELHDANHKTFSSSILGDDGKWFTFMTAKYTRKP